MDLYLQSMLLLFFFTNTCSTEAVRTEVSHMHCFHTVVTLLLPLIFITFFNMLLLTPSHQIHVLVSLKRITKDCNNILMVKWWVGKAKLLYFMVHKMHFFLTYTVWNWWVYYGPEVHQWLSEQLIMRFLCLLDR